MVNISLKYFVALPVAILFISATNPSEFAASLNSIGISYKVGYSVAIALRYIPDIQRDYHSISQAQQARGVELGKSEPFFARLKNSVSILLPLILTSLNRIDTISPLPSGILPPWLLAQRCCWSACLLPSGTAGSITRSYDP